MTDLEKSTRTDLGKKDLIVDRQNGQQTSPKSVNLGQIFFQPLILWPKIAFLEEKHYFPRLAACRRRFFMVKNVIFDQKMSFFWSKPVSIAKTKFFCTSRVIPLMVYDKPYRNEKHVLLREHHGNFFNREKSATVPTKPIFSKVSVVFPFRDFLGRIQNRHGH